MSKNIYNWEAEMYKIKHQDKMPACPCKVNCLFNFPTGQSASKHQGPVPWKPEGTPQRLFKPMLLSQRAGCREMFSLRCSEYHTCTFESQVSESPPVVFYPFKVFIVFSIEEKGGLMKDSVVSYRVHNVY